MKHAQCTIIQLDEPARETWTSSLDFCLHVRFVSKCLYLPELSRPIILSVSSSRCKTMTTNNSLKNSYASGCSWDKHWVVHCSKVVPGGHNFKSSWAAKFERDQGRAEALHSASLSDRAHMLMGSKSGMHQFMAKHGYLLGGWAYPSEKWWSSSVGVMTFPIYGKMI